MTRQATSSSVYTHWLSSAFLVFLISQVNLNGVLSFNQACNVITPQPFPYKGYAMISLFWENFETARFGHVYYRTTTDSLLLTRTQRYVEDTFPSIGGFNPSYLLIATWDRVPQNTVYSGGHTDLVSKYQLLETLLCTFGYITLHTAQKR